MRLVGPIAFVCLLLGGAADASQEQGLRVQVSLAPFAFPGPIVGKPRSTVLVSVHVTHPPVMDILEEKVGIIINVFTDRGKHVTDVHHKVDVKASGRNTVPAYEVVSRVELEPGRYRFRVGAGTADGKTGHGTADVVVPRFGKRGLAASAIVLTPSPRAYAAHVGGVQEFLSVVPTAERVFTAAQKVSALVRVYWVGQRRPGLVKVSAELLDARHAIVFAAQQDLDSDAFLSFIGGYRMDHAVTLPTDKLPPGDYVLRFSVSAGKANAAPSPVRFSVVPAGR